MSGNHTSRWIKLLHQLYRAAPEFSTKNVLVPGACFACGSVLLYFASNKSNSKIFKNSFTDKSFVAYAAAPKLHSESKSAENETKKESGNLRERRFHEFASVEIKGEHYMTPQDFLESVTEENPRPRIGRIQITEDQAKAMLAKTPDRRKNSSRFFRSLHEKGLISYTEYLFFLCILTKPKAGFEIAFNMFDTDGNQRVDKKEFMVLGEIFRKRTESTCGHKEKLAINEDKSNADRVKSIPGVSKRIMAIQQNSDTFQDTTLLIHLFGKRGNNDLYYEDFYKFMDNLQTEVLEMEFLASSRGLLTISEEDFAWMLLKYTDVDDTEEYINTLRKRIPQEKGITFEEFRSFFQFLNNLEDFAIAMQMYTLAGRSIGQDEFKRAVKVSTGHELSEHLVDTLFKLFDKDDDSRLSQVEFMGVMKERMQRGFRPRSVKDCHGWSGFQKCLRYQIRSAASSF